MLTNWHGTIDVNQELDFLPSFFSANFDEQFKVGRETGLFVFSSSWLLLQISVLFLHLIFNVAASRVFASRNRGDLITLVYVSINFSPKMRAGSHYWKAITEKKTNKFTQNIKKEIKL
jgi:hypothetical protein